MEPRTRPMDIIDFSTKDNGGKESFSINREKRLDKSTEKMNLDFYRIPHTEINLKWIIDLNTEAKTVRFLG